MLILQRHQLGVAAAGGGVDGKRPFGREAMKVTGAAGLGAGSREPLAAEGLNPDDGADHIAIDIGVADAQAVMDVTDGGFDPAVDAQSQAVAGALSR